MADKLDFGTEGDVLGSNRCIYASDGNGFIMKINPSTGDEFAYVLGRKCLSSIDRANRSLGLTLASIGLHMIDIIILSLM